MKLIQMRDHRINKQTVQKRQEQYSRCRVLGGQSTSEGAGKAMNFQKRLRPLNFWGAVIRSSAKCSSLTC
jgi:hypothetical protein